MAPSRSSPMVLREDTVNLKASDLRQSNRPPRTRFPSLSEFPDSPSVYSHAYQTPDVNDVNSDAASFSHLSDGADSSSEYGEETAPTLHSVSTENAQDSDLGDYNDSESDDDASHRISVQGPKIRFHSRAPWETEEPAIAEESDSSSRSGTIGSRFRGKKPKADSLIRTFGRAASITSRPSIDSARSQISATPSFEITAGNYSSSRGALYALAKESLSATSLSSNPATSSFPHGTNYPHLAHHDTRSSLSRSTGEPAELARTSTNHENSHRPSDIYRIGHDRSATQSSLPLSQEQPSREEFVHPYANPDLVSPYDPASLTKDMSRSDSSSTVTDAMSTRSRISSIMSTETSATSLTSREYPHGGLRVHGKEISSPIAVLRPNDTCTGYVDNNTKFLSLHHPPAGLDGHRFPNRSSTVTLISLQEAQARERSRSSTIHTTIVQSSKEREDGGSQLPFPCADSPHEETEDQSREAIIASLLARSRARSTSAGTRSKVTQHPLAQSHKTERKDSDSISTSSGARQLRHRKSGFMRLFSGRNSEGDPPPPIPTLPEEHSLETAKPSKFALPRLHSAGGSSTTMTGGDSDWKGPSSRKRHLPSLSIVTGGPDHRAPTSAVGFGLPSASSLAPPSLPSGAPQSAPPGTTDFQVLTLRPVSTSFSSHFADIVASPGQQSQPDVQTPSSSTSPGTAAFPLTPVSTRRSDDAPATMETPGEQYLSVKGLQGQLVSAKKAWQQQVRELQGQIRDLTAELEELRGADKEYCEVCCRGDPHRRYPSPMDDLLKKVGTVNRPRARIGDAARFASGK